MVPSVAVAKKEHFTRPPTGGPRRAQSIGGTKPEQRLANGVLEDDDEEDLEEEEGREAPTVFSTSSIITISPSCHYAYHSTTKALDRLFALSLSLSPTTTTTTSLKNT